MKAKEPFQQMVMEQEDTYKQKRKYMHTKNPLPNFYTSYKN